MKIKQANKYYIKKREFKLLTNCFLTFNILEKKKIMELNFQMVFLEWNLECCVREKVLVWLWELLKFVKIPFLPFGVVLDGGRTAYFIIPVALISFNSSKSEFCLKPFKLLSQKKMKCELLSDF